MGQYWKPVNLDKREFIDPHKLGDGLKLWEQLASHPGTGAALIVLCAAMPAPRGGGDLDADPVIGRWAVDRVALIGDYAEDSDLKDSPVPASKLYGLCRCNEAENSDPAAFRDITAAVRAVIERELNGRYVGEDYEFVENKT